MLGVVNEVPVANEVPPVATSYQFIVPAEATAPSITEPVSQRDAGVVEVIEGEMVMLAVTDVLAAVVQPAATAST